MSILNTLREENNFNREEIIVAMEAMMDEILNDVAMDSAIESTDFYADPCVSIGKSYLGAMEAISEDKAEKTLEKLNDLEEEVKKLKKEKDHKKKWKILKMVLGAVLAIAASIGAIAIVKKLKKIDGEFNRVNAEADKLRQENENLSKRVDNNKEAIDTNKKAIDTNKSELDKDIDQVYENNLKYKKGTHLFEMGIIARIRELEAIIKQNNNAGEKKE